MVALTVLSARIQVHIFKLNVFPLNDFFLKLKCEIKKNRQLNVPRSVNVEYCNGEI